MQAFLTLLSVVGLLVFTVNPLTNALGIEGWSEFLFAASYGFFGGAVARALSRLAGDY